MNDSAHDYLLQQVMAQGTQIHLLYDLLVRYRLDLAQEALEDLQAIARRSQPLMQKLLARSANDWQEMIEAQQALLQAESRNAGRP